MSWKSARTYKTPTNVWSFLSHFQRSYRYSVLITGLWVCRLISHLICVAIASLFRSCITVLIVVCQLMPSVILLHVCVLAVRVCAGVLASCHIILAISISLACNPTYNIYIYIIIYVQRAAVNFLEKHNGLQKLPLVSKKVMSELGHLWSTEINRTC